MRAHLLRWVALQLLLLRGTRTAEDNDMLGVARAHFVLRVRVLVLNHVVVASHAHVVVLLIELILVEVLLVQLLLLHVLKLLLEHELVGKLLVHAGGNHGCATSAHTRHVQLLLLNLVASCMGKIIL